MSSAQRLAAGQGRKPRTRPRPLYPAPTAPLGAALVELHGAPSVVFQPIVAVATGQVVAVEALSRFADGDDTEQVFTATRADGSGPALEAVCLAAAFDRRDQLPAGMLLNVNISPNALPYAAATNVWPTDLRGVVVEITEHDVENTLEFNDYLTDLRSRGAAIAIDDVSSGYAGLLRLAQIRPDYVKIDRRVVSGVGDSFAQSAVLEALVTLSHRLGAAVIGEGVEDVADLDALTEFDVDYVQGYAIARPSAQVEAIAADVVAACRSSRRRLLQGASATGHAAARTRDVYAITAALASADGRDDISGAIRAAAQDLRVDAIGVSVLATGMNLREIANTCHLDPTIYSLADFPITLAAMTGGDVVEVQAGDPDSDPAEREVMNRLGHASLLIVPLVDGERTIGVIEFAQRTTRRWSAQDLAHAQGLAEHLSPALKRLGVGAVDAPAPAV